MRIAIDIVSTENEGAKQLLLHWITKIAATASENQFFIVTAEKLSHETFDIVEVKKPSRLLGISIWQQWHLKSILKKNHIDCLIGTSAYSKKICAQQYVLQSCINITYIKSKLKIGSQDHTLFLTAAALQAAQNRYVQAKLSLLPAMPKEDVGPVSFMQQENFKTEHTGGKDYFLTLVENDEHVFKSSLQAYSQFKKWQKSSLQLVVIVNAEELNAKLQTLLDTYKFASDVTILMGTTKFYSKYWLQWLGAAYAFMLHQNMFDYPLCIVQSFQMWIPVIGCHQNEMLEEFPNGVEWFEYENSKSLSQKMILVYKDETLRQKLIQNGNAWLANRAISNDPYAIFSADAHS